MLKRSYLGLVKPTLTYEKLAAPPKQIRQIPLPPFVTCVFDIPFEKTTELKLQKGDSIKRGQLMILKEGIGGTRVSPVAGTITEISAFSGDFGHRCTAVTIDVMNTEATDDGFAACVETPEFESARNYLCQAPGKPALDHLVDPEKPIDTIVIDAVDKDILVGTRQYVLKTDLDAVIKGIGLLKGIVDVENIIMVVTREQFQGYGHIGASVKAVDNAYPAGNPNLIVSQLLNKEMAAGQSFEDVGVLMIGIEAIASIGHAYAEGAVPLDKVITFINKDGTQSLAKARIGTPVGNVLSAHGVNVKEKDQVIFGGPMTGQAVPGVDHPILADTDAVLIQDRDDIPLSSDYPCINCGDCIRICPVNIPIDMLVRFLEAGEYQEAADQYALDACIECGLCSYVCVSRIPIFQYIKLGKFELSRQRSAEAAND